MSTISASQLKPAIAVIVQHQLKLADVFSSRVMDTVEDLCGVARGGLQSRSDEFHRLAAEVLTEANKPNRPGLYVELGEGARVTVQRVPHRNTRKPAVAIRTYDTGVRLNSAEWKQLCQLNSVVRDALKVYQGQLDKKITSEGNAIMAKLQGDKKWKAVQLEELNGQAVVAVRIYVLNDNYQWEITKQGVALTMDQWSVLSSYSGVISAEVTKQSYP